VIAFHPGSGGAYKLWPWTGWEQIMTWTAQQGLQGLLISGPAEQAHHAHLPHPAHFPPWPWAQNLPLPSLAALLARCQIMVGHDSGITHLAAAVGTTTLALFGPTDPLLWGPRSRRACVLQPASPGPLTLTHLPPDSVIQILASMLRGTFALPPRRPDVRFCAISAHLAYRLSYKARHCLTQLSRRQAKVAGRGRCEGGATSGSLR
jgi:hypothetical protein